MGLGRVRGGSGTYRSHMCGGTEKIRKICSQANKSIGQDPNPGLNICQTGMLNTQTATSGRKTKCLRVGGLVCKANTPIKFIFPCLMQAGHQIASNYTRNYIKRKVIEQ
jgi:hypothetical protein